MASLLGRSCRARGDPRRKWPRSRNGTKRGIVFACVQGTCLAVLVTSVFLPLWRHVLEDGAPDTAAHRVGARPGQVVVASELGISPQSVKALGDAELVKGLRTAGRSFAIVLKGGFTASARDLDYGLPDDSCKVRLAYVFEVLAQGRIESNDGRRITEVIHLEKVRAIKLLSEVEDLAIDLHKPEVPVLETLTPWEPIAGNRAVDPRPVIEATIREEDRPRIESAGAKAFMHTDSLSGKPVRITHLDGVGVESLQPIGCSLTRLDCCYLSSAPLLVDGFSFPGRGSGEGDGWHVDGSQLTWFFDPSMRAVPRGRAMVRRGKDDRDGSFGHVELTLWSDCLRLPSLRPAFFQCVFSPLEGALRYNVEDKYVQTAVFRAPVNIQTWAVDHLLAYVHIETEPTLVISYHCRLR